MNIFYLHNDPQTCAELHCDKHVVKMIIEYAQLLSTAHRMLDGDEYIEMSAKNRRVKRWRLSDYREAALYKACHMNHPSAIWTRQSDANYQYLYELWKHLCEEYTNRYGRIHATQNKLINYLDRIPDNIPKAPFTEPPPAMKLYPQCIVKNDSIQSYINYYREAKAHFAKWTNRPVPQFMN